MLCDITVQVYCDCCATFCLLAFTMMNQKSITYEGAVQVFLQKVSVNCHTFHS